MVKEHDAFKAAMIQRFLFLQALALALGRTEAC